MKFTVTYRTSSGALDSAVFEAESRAALFVLLKEHGITAIRVESGINQKPKRRPIPSTSILLVAGVALTLALGALLVFNFTTKPAKSGKSAHTRSSDKIITKGQPHNKERAAEKRYLQSPVDKKNKQMEKGVEILSSSVRTNSSGAVIEQLKLADGRTIRKIHPPKPLFENPSDQLIAMAISVKPGQSMPPLPLDASIEKDFMNSLLKPIVINEDDTPEIKELKARVMETRAYLVDEVKSGSTVLEALRAHQSEMEMMADATTMAVRELQKVRDESGEEEAKLFAERINESFRARGIPELSFPEEQVKGQQVNSARRRKSK